MANGVVQYDRNNHQIRTQYLPRELQKTIMHRYCVDFPKRHMNDKGGLMLTCMHYHADEGYINKHNVWEYSVDHVHIGYIPVATGFKQGLYLQNSMNKAMAALGFTGNDCYEQWVKREQAYLEEITKEEYKIYCEQHPDFAKLHGDLEVIHPVSDGEYDGNQEKEDYVREKELDEREADIEAKINENVSKFNEKVAKLNEGVRTHRKRKEALQRRIEALESKEKQVAEQAKQNERFLQQLHGLAKEINKQITIKNQVASLEDIPDKQRDLPYDLED